MMTSRERVRRCVEFDKPDRVPRDLWMLPIAALEHDAAALELFKQRWPTDFGWAPVPNPGLEAMRKGDWYAIGTFRDEWGCEFENLQAGVIGEVKHPPLADWSRLEDLRPPEAALKIDREAINRFCPRSDKFVSGDALPRPFERMQFLRGSENLYMDIAEESDEFLELRQIVHDFFCKELEVWCRTKVDGVKFMDDWGAQRGLLISPEKWVKLFKPLYADYVKIAHDAGKKIFMHSDGHIQDIYPHLVDLKVDAVNSQLFCMPIEELSRRFKGKITFWGEIDRQHLLSYATPAEVREGVRRVVENLYSPEGGVIAQFEFGAATKLANADAAFSAWEEFTQPLR
ncbi:MAG TPA: uroporphyrinogen decarboxylase family protein [Tepidisphaeraceae bacterium]|jgi:hypothetical protein